MTASYTAILYNLTTSASPVAGGLVTADPSQATYTYGQQVTLTAVPNNGYTFSSWSGGWTTNPRTITITGNTSVTANFAAIPYTLTTSAIPSGGGSVTLSPSQATYTFGQQVTLTANPNTGYSFGSWSGGASGTTNPTTITITGNTSVTANFTVPTALSITSTGGYTPFITVTTSPTITWTFPGGTPPGSTSPTPGDISFSDTTVRTSTLTVDSMATVSSFEIHVPEQAAGQQAHEIQSIEIGNLSNLKRLYLYDVGLTSLPNVNLLHSLEALYCSNNFLGGTNQRWNGLTNLKVGHCFGNNFSAQEVDRLFEDLDANGVTGGEFDLTFNAGPSADSATARTNLVNRGNTLHYNTMLSDPGHSPDVTAAGLDIQVAGNTGFTITTAPTATNTDIKVDVQDVGVAHYVAAGTAVYYYLGNATQIRNIHIEVTPASDLTGLAFNGSGRQDAYIGAGTPPYIQVPNGNIVSISGLENFANLQHLAFFPANVLQHIFVPNGVGANLTVLELWSATGITSPLAGTDADALIAALVAAGDKTGKGAKLYLPNRTAASDAAVVTLTSLGWELHFQP